MNGVHDKLFRDYAADRSVANRNRIVVAYMNLAERITTVFRTRVEAADIDDLRSAGYMGLITAVERYDLGRGVPFMGFAGRRIHGAMFDACRREDILSRPTRHRIKAWDEGVMQFRQVHGYPPTHEEVEALLGIDTDQWKLDINAGWVSSMLTTNFEWFGEEDKFEKVASGQPGPLQIAESNDGFEYMMSTDTLSTNEQTALRLKYAADRTFKQIAKHFDCSESTISYLCKDAREKIRAKLVA